MKMIKKEITNIVVSNLKSYVGATVSISGVINKLQNHGGLIFIKLSDHTGTVQCVVETSVANVPQLFKKNDWIKVTGSVVTETRAIGGFEIHVQTIGMLSEGNHEQIPSNPEYYSNLRSISLRSLKNQAVFKIKSALQVAFINFLHSQGFTLINTPKIIFNHDGVDESEGSNLFQVNYFGKDAYLTQSPQLFKQMLIGGLQRVFELAHVFRANNNMSSRQLTEYISLDVEFGPIDSLDDLLVMCTALINYALSKIQEQKSEIALLKCAIPSTVEVTPSITYEEAVDIVGKSLSRTKLSQHALKKWGSEFLFVTNQPLTESTFYFMEDSDNPGTAKRFILLFRGMAIGGGGQRIHNHAEQLKIMEQRGINAINFEKYLTAHKWGLPPHGGFTISLERFVMQLLGLQHIKGATLFPPLPPK